MISLRTCVFVSVLCLCLSLSVGQSTNEYVSFCPVDDHLVEQVVRDPETGQFVLKTDNATRRSLEVEDKVDLHRWTQEEEEVFQARRCSCHTESYCQMEYDSCGIPADSSNEPVACFQYSAKVILIRNAWPIVMLWYGALLVFLLCIRQGRYARQYMTRPCFRHQNEHMVDRMLEQEQQRANANRPPSENAILSQLVLRRVAESIQQTPARLELKTKRYVADTTVPPQQQEGEESSTCAICLSPLEEGERVGALTCNHQFHVECLKTWLPRRNACPLCQTPNIATTRFDAPARQGDATTVTTAAATTVTASTTLSPLEVDSNPQTTQAGQTISQRN